MRRVLVVAVAVAAVVVPATAAWARGDGWQKVDAEPYDWTCGTTTVHVSFPVNREWIRFIEQPDGSVVLQVTGYITQTFSTDDGASVTVNVSGPGKPIQYPNNDFELRAWGLSSLILTEEQAAELGTPQIALVKGPLDVIFHEDGSVTPIRIPKVITDLCAELGA